MQASAAAAASRKLGEEMLETMMVSNDTATRATWGRNLVRRTAMVKSHTATTDATEKPSPSRKPGRVSANGTSKKPHGPRVKIS